MNRRIAVIGLGYVGLPVVLAFAKKFPGTIGFDIKAERVRTLLAGEDTSGDIDAAEIRETSAQFTSDVAALREADVFIVAVPTPIDQNHNPDLRALTSASQIVGSAMRRGSIVVYESTVYPSVTEEVCGPVLAEASGLKQGIDFKLGYSPERINPGDREHTLERITKIVSGEDEATLSVVAELYGKVVTAGIHRAPSIRVAEAAKVIENTQRDLNIALMNELAIIFDRMGISTRDVLDAAGTKWNFLRFNPGLVGGHCIGVDPYYLTTKAEQVGYHPQVILAGRRINDGMGSYVAQRVVKLMVNQGISIKGARVGILGVTFKENVTDLRNSRVPDIISELKQFGVEPLVHDPCAKNEDAVEELGLELSSWDTLQKLDGLVVAVAHRFYLDQKLEASTSKLKPRGVFVDVKCAFKRENIPSDYVYWSL